MPGEVVNWKQKDQNKVREAVINREIITYINDIN